MYSWFGAEGVRSRRQDLGCKVQGLGYKVQGLGLEVQGLGCKAQGLGFEVQGWMKMKLFLPHECTSLVKG